MFIFLCSISKVYHLCIQQCFYFVSHSSPNFIDFRNSTVRYEHFCNSHKPRGDVCDEVMCAYGKMFNLDGELSSSSSAKCRKYTFSPYLSTKLTKDPGSFDKRACIREISRINSKISLATVDLMDFPMLLPNH
ncbi:hypothetical protein ACQ4PT_050411 [Festuca glaucescens]